MSQLLTETQMRDLETAAIDAGHVTGLELMERAGQGVVDAIFAQWPELDRTERHAVILCGPGNNGGDGFVVARLLHDAGWAVDVFAFGDPKKLPPSARANFERWCEVGRVNPLKLEGVMAKRPFDLWVDAVFGIGLSRPLAGDVAAFFDYVEEDLATFANRSVAIDIASGLCADSGRWLGPIWEPALTITFHTKKLGHIIDIGGTITSTQAIKIVDIGLSGGSNDAKTKSVVLIEQSCTRALNKSQGHKYGHGHALILSGGVGHGGAARLAARGALRIGAGVVTLGCPPAALLENAVALDAVMTRRVADDLALDVILQDDRINALCIGPGFGTGDDRPALIRTALETGRAMVLDADALTLIAADPTLFDRLHNRCVLTPHLREFTRLFPEIAATLSAPATHGPAYSKVDAARAAAERCGAVVLFKGADTVIADPKGQVSINAAVAEDAAPWLATAGSGDVLAGFITGLLARGFAPMRSAETGAWLHAAAARSFGPGLIAEDLPEQLPQVFRDIGL